MNPKGQANATVALIEETTVILDFDGSSIDPGNLQFNSVVLAIRHTGLQFGASVKVSVDGSPVSYDEAG
jgi:hypothetical protein